jgi:hypothetical protein
VPAARFEELIFSGAAANCGALYNCGGIKCGVQLWDGTTIEDDRPTMRAGFRVAIASKGTSPVATDPAPIMAGWPP